MTPSFLFDPRTLITGPFRHCPECGGRNQFGVLSVHAHHYVRRCRECRHSASEALPRLDKKILYLDQFALSRFVRVAATESEPRAGDEFWNELFATVTRLVRLQLLLCPESEFHQDESLVSPMYGPLRSMYVVLASGTHFRDHTTVWARQLAEDAKLWQAGRPSSPPVNVRHALDGNLDGWSDRILVTARTDYSEERLDEMRRSRDETHAALASTFERWREGRRTFDEIVREEAMGWVSAVLDAYAGYYGRVVAWQDGLETAPEELFPPSAVLIVKGLEGAMAEAGVRPEQVLGSTLDYLSSGRVYEVPFLKIMSMLFAAAARKAMAGQMRPPTRGFVTDVRVLSTVLPYCDAVLVDNECAAFLAERPLSSALAFGSKVFSLNQRDQLLEWLYDIELSASREHLALAAEVYGEPA